MGACMMWGGWVLGCFFFFQAEDGIRDDLVTGVQTCALPICLYFIVLMILYCRYVKALRSLLIEKVERLGVDVPPLCSCGENIWDTHPDLCANNCPFYKNPKGMILWIVLLRSPCIEKYFIFNHCKTDSKNRLKPPHLINMINLTSNGNIVIPKHFTLLLPFHRHMTLTSIIIFSM